MPNKVKSINFSKLERNLVRWDLMIIGILLVGIWLSFSKKYNVFPLDDAYIHLAYVRNLIDSGTFGLNPGEASAGNSSPLWVIVLSCFYLFKLDLYWTVQILCLLCYAGLCIIVADIVKRSTVKAGFSADEACIYSIIAGLLLVLNGNIQWFALSGMETMLFLFLSFLSVNIYCRRGFDHITGIITGLLLLTRIPGVLLVIIFVLFEILKKRTWLKGIIAFFVVISPYLFTMKNISGDIFPTTAKGKTLTYVDEGFNWEHIRINEIWNNLLLQKLLDGKIIERDKQNQTYFNFHNLIENEQQLIKQLDKIDNIQKEPFVALWRSTHRNHIYWYLKTFLLYQKYQPQNFLLLFITCLTGVIFIIKYSKRKWKGFKKTVLEKYPECFILALWGIGHLLIYTVKFRSPFHHNRYLANEYIILVILGIFSLALLSGLIPRINWKIYLGLIAIVMTGSKLFYWRTVYANNIKHIDEAYIQMGKWIEQNTPPSARVAAFDIGVLRYVGNRYTIDLGGLTDPAAHPYLKKKACGEYINKKEADYVLYSRYPYTDFISRINLAEYEGPMLIKQSPVVSFETPQYPTPTITHSYRTDLTKISGWFPPTREGILKLFSYDGRPFQTIGEMVDDRLEFLGYTIDQRSIRYIPPYPFIINISFFYKAQRPLKHPYWGHLAFFDLRQKTIHSLFSYMPTNNLLTYEQWPVNQAVMDHHVHFINSGLPQKKYRVKLTFSEEEFIDKTHPEKYNWFDLGEFENKKNQLRLMDYKQLMAVDSEEDT
jgi:hypothetical protein